jgi:hypothetical protein
VLRCSLFKFKQFRLLACSDLTSDFLLSLYVIMKQICITILVFTLIFSGCKKNVSPRLSGTDTIDNNLYGSGPYYAMGFSFPASKKISTLNSPRDVFTVNAFPGNFDKSYFDAQNFNNSFCRYATYTDATTATLAFKNLKSFSVSQWKATGDSIKAHQIWIFKTSSDTYAKFRIISTTGEIRNSVPFVECTFEWVYQPDGSLTFPGK